MHLVLSWIKIPITWESNQTQREVRGKKLTKLKDLFKKNSNKKISWLVQWRTSRSYRFNHSIKNFGNYKKSKQQSKNDEKDANKEHQFIIRFEAHFQLHDDWWWYRYDYLLKNNFYLQLTNFVKNTENINFARFKTAVKNCANSN